LAPGLADEVGVFAQRTDTSIIKAIAALV